MGRAEYLRYVRGLQPAAFRPTRSKDLPWYWQDRDAKGLNAPVGRFVIFMLLAMFTAFLGAISPILGVPSLICAILVLGSTLQK